MIRATCHVPEQLLCLLYPVTRELGRGVMFNSLMVTTTGTGGGVKHVASKTAMLESAADHNTVSTNLNNSFTCQQLTTVLFLRLYLVDEMQMQG